MSKWAQVSIFVVCLVAIQVFRFGMSFGSDQSVALAGKYIGGFVAFWVLAWLIGFFWKNARSYAVVFASLLSAVVTLAQ